MNIKTLILNFILMLVAAMITALLVLAGSRYLDNKSDNSASSTFFSSQQVDDKKNLQFVEVFIQHQWVPKQKLTLPYSSLCSQV